MPSKRRDYKKEAKYHAQPEQIANRVKRNKARRDAIRKYGKAALVGKDVDHKVPLSRGGSNDPKNIQITSVHYNRSVKDKRGTTTKRRAR